MNTKSITICFICQGGSKYEIMAKILCITTRYYNPDIKIVVGIPTPFNIYPEPNRDTYNLLEKLNIQYVYTNNYVSHNYKVANKFGLLHKINTEIETDYILFLDTDIICLGKLIPTREMLLSDISGVYTDFCDKPNRNNGLYWKSLHDKLDIEYNIPDKPIGYSHFTQSTIWAPYLCAGYLFMKKNPNFTQTLNDICNILYNDIGERFKIPKNWGGKAAPDQQAIALTINKLKLKFHILDSEHIYSLIPGHYLPTHKNTLIDINTLVSDIEFEIQDNNIVNNIQHSIEDRINNIETNIGIKLNNSNLIQRVLHIANQLGIKYPTHVSSEYRNKIQTNDKICCKYCYDTFITSQQFIHYHKPSRIFEFFFDMKLSVILSKLKKNKWPNDSDWNKGIDNYITDRVSRRYNNKPIFSTELKKQLIDVISKTKHEDWYHSIHNVD